MKRLPRDPLRFDAFDQFATFGEKTSTSLRDPASVDSFLTRVKEAVGKGLSNDAFVFGQRTEALFERIVASLGGCTLIKREDLGSVFHAFDYEIQPPDYRILLDGGEQLLVEVKNFHQHSSADREFRQSLAYVEALRRYAAAMGSELLFAIYWVQWNIWTLVPISAFRTDGGTLRLSLTDALLVNKFGRLGDKVIGTRWPLRFRVLPDGTEPVIGSDERVTFATGAREIYCEDRRLVNRAEQRLAIFLAMYGDWQVLDTVMEVHDQKLMSVELLVGPQEDRGHLKSQGYGVVGLLSSMISKLHNSSTARDAHVSAIREDFEPDEVGRILPDDHRGDCYVTRPLAETCRSRCRLDGEGLT
jgi:hypothetical protein